MLEAFGATGTKPSLELPLRRRAPSRADLYPPAPDGIDHLAQIVGPEAEEHVLQLWTAQIETNTATAGCHVRA
jgi:hypothetical protein